MMSEGIAYAHDCERARGGSAVVQDRDSSSPQPSCHRGRRLKGIVMIAKDRDHAKWGLQPGEREVGKAHSDPTHPMIRHEVSAEKDNIRMECIDPVDCLLEPIRRVPEACDVDISKEHKLYGRCAGRQSAQLNRQIALNRRSARKPDHEAEKSDRSGDEYRQHGH